MKGLEFVREAVHLMDERDIRALYDALFEIEYVTIRWKVANAGASCQIEYVNDIDYDAFYEDWNGYDLVLYTSDFFNIFSEEATEKQRLYFHSLSEEEVLV